MTTNYTQDSILKLTIKNSLNNKTIIDSMFFTPPFKIIEPFYMKNMANLMILNVSPGLMRGDNQKIILNIKENSNIKITSQSYEKIHDTQDEIAKKDTTIILDNNANLYYTPLPCIPFKNSNFRGISNIFINEDSVLYYSEIFCAGRIALGEIFAFKEFHTTTNIYKCNELIFYDNMKLNPKTMDLNSLCLFDSYTHYMQILIHDKEFQFYNIQEIIINSSINAAISKNNGIFIIKALGNSGEELLEFQDLIGI